MSDCLAVADLRNRAARRRPRWDSRCTELVARHAARLSNAELADLIAAETGLRFRPKTVSEHRAALGIRAPQHNAWTAPLRRWRPWGVT